MVIDLEQIGAVALAYDLASSDGIPDPVVHAGGLDVAFSDVPLEEAGIRDVAGLEESDQGREPGEPFGVRVGASDEREHLQFTLEVGPVVGEHMAEVVLREVRGGARGGAG